MGNGTIYNKTINSMNSNNYAKQRERALIRKLELIRYKGGKCEKCGYSNNLAALDFHHIDPKTKSFQLDSRHLSNTNIDKLKDEVNKCILLCANCHRETHYPNYNEGNIDSLLEEITSRCVRVLGPKQKQVTCPICGKEFDYKKGKIYCSTECRKKAMGMDKYPQKEEVEALYQELHSWDKVAKSYGLTRKIIQRIRNKTHNQ